MPSWIGYRWLSAHYGVEPVQPFRTDSQLARRRKTERINGFTHEFYPAHFKPADTFEGHMTFALKREGVHLEFFARLFKVLLEGEISAWVNTEPSGQYARRAGFFYEWLTGRPLTFKGVNVGNYINALDEARYLTATQPENVPRWRIRDNLPGTRDYCPLVHRTDRVHAAEDYDCRQLLHDLEVEYGEDLLMRSAVWLTIKESLASFEIEHEDKQIDRVKRFAAVIEKRCGNYLNPLDEAVLTELQSEILGPKATRYGLRKSPVFVGEADSALMPVVHYIAPHWKDTTSMLAGLRSFAQRTLGKPSLVRAAVLSFGFVYIHPMADGNGRISRFLINDVLRRDGTLPEPFILPVSATITSTAVHRRGYDQVLEIFSKPLMQRYRDQYRFGPERIAEDGIRYNLDFDAYEEAQAAWRYLDLTEHVEYLAHIIHLTIDQEMRKEASTLRSLHAARSQIKEVIEGPDADIDRIIRSVRDNNGQLSNKLRKEFPLLDNPKTSSEVIRIVRAMFCSPAHDTSGTTSLSD